MHLHRLSQVYPHEQRRRSRFQSIRLARDSHRPSKYIIYRQARLSHVCRPTTPFLTTWIIPDDHGMTSRTLNHGVRRLRMQE
jgi:hypothetical protein